MDGSQSVMVLSWNNTYIREKFNELKRAGPELKHIQFEVVNDINLEIAVHLQSQNIHLEHLNILVIPTGSLGI